MFTEEQHWSDRAVAVPLLKKSTCSILRPIPIRFGYTVGGCLLEGATYTLFTWVLGTTDAGNMTVDAPASAVIGTTGTINLTFSGLDPATRYLGSVAYSGVSGLPNPTIVRVDTP
jgi:hypothetical protein